MNRRYLAFNMAAKAKMKRINRKASLRVNSEQVASAAHGVSN